MSSCSVPLPNTHTSHGRRNRDRTCDLCLVRAALFQLSYPPDFPGKLGDATKSIRPCQPNLALFLHILRSVLLFTHNCFVFRRACRGKKVVCTSFSRSRSTCV